MDLLRGILDAFSRGGRVALVLLLAGGAILVGRANDIWPFGEVSDDLLPWIVVATSLGGAIVLIDLGQGIYGLTAKGWRRWRRHRDQKHRDRAVVDSLFKVTGSARMAVYWMLRTGYSALEENPFRPPFYELVRHRILVRTDPDSDSSWQQMRLSPFIVERKEELLKNVPDAARRQIADDDPPWVDRGGY